ncbi:MAG: hypothetical protein EZS28_010593 [Streblomastix strix]|uniref:Uncharacterized protein n=1 Tax=Streblomastix strix TaxID=222440 RepID=A0A5J4WH46_9EUKA|nr:MAG: hypothetical protein EZS28_010593 [Streblomastix strix]
MLIYDTGVVDKEGIITIDLKKINSSEAFAGKIKNVTDFSVYKNGAKADDPSFLSIPKAEIHGLKSKPSKKIVYKNIPENLTEEEKKAFQDITIEQTCDSITAFAFLSFGINNQGLVDSTCIPNTEIPNQTQKCSNGSKITKYLKGYKQALFIGGVEDIKEALIRFGAIHYIASSDTDTDSIGIIIGWENNEWIVIRGLNLETQIITENIPTTQIYSGYVLVDAVIKNCAYIGMVFVSVMIPLLALFW